MLSEIKRLIKRILYFGFARTCPVCGCRSRRYRPHKDRREALCPSCGAFERHRLMWLFLQMKTDLFDGHSRKLLHFAPEEFLAKHFSALPDIEYISGDLDASNAMMRIDVTDIQFSDDHFDAVICSHVLEHVPDDRAGMRELLRVLKPGGWALLQVPIKGGNTHEDLTITDPQERERLFGQKDHVRQYGLDFADRLKTAGFQVEVVSFEQIITSEEMTKYGISPDQRIFFCRKD